MHPALIPSNLGQILGRALLGEVAAASAPAPVPAAPKPALPGKRRAQLLELLAARKDLGVGEIAAALGISREAAGMLVKSAHASGAVARSGEERQYRYSLP